MDCIFCKIASGEIKTEFLYEDSEIVAFSDAKPIAPVHILIIPKKHIETVDDLKDDDQALVGKMILAARDLARKSGTAERGYKLLFRVKKGGGQEVAHIHLHLIGGAKLYEDIHPI